MYTTKTGKLGEAEGSWGAAGRAGKAAAYSDCRVSQALEIEDDKTGMLVSQQDFRWHA